jgi:glutaredoxin
MKQIVMYSAEMCHDCQMLKQFMGTRGIDYETRDIRKEPRHAAELEEKTGKLGVPYLIIGGEWVRGYEPGQPFSESFACRLFGLDG